MTTERALPDAREDMNEALATTRRIGAATVTIITEGALPWAPRYIVPEDEWRRAIPDADSDGRIVLGLNPVLIRVGTAVIMVDPGCDDPSSAWQQTFASRLSGVTRSLGLGVALESIGVKPAAVTHVLITHAHEDHFAGVMVERGGQLAARFPRARHLLGHADWDGNPRRQEPGSTLAVRLGGVERLGLLDLIGGEHEVAAGVTMIPAPGESPGHYVISLRSGDEAFYYLGDLIHHACEVEHPDWMPGQARDRTTLLASRARLLPEIATSRALVVFTHERFPGGGRIVPAGAGFRWERDW